MPLTGHGRPVRVITLSERLAPGSYPPRTVPRLRVVEHSVQSGRCSLNNYLHDLRRGPEPVLRVGSSFNAISGILNAMPKLATPRPSGRTLGKLQFYH